MRDPADGDTLVHSCRHRLKFVTEALDLATQGTADVARLWEVHAEAVAPLSGDEALGRIGLVRCVTQTTVRRALRIAESRDESLQ